MHTEPLNLMLLISKNNISGVDLICIQCNCCISLKCPALFNEYEKQNIQ